MNSADMPRGVVRRCSALAVVQLGPFELRRAGCVFSGSLEIAHKCARTAQQMAAHESARTTGLYDHRGDEISLDEVERIAI